MIKILICMSAGDCDSMIELSACPAPFMSSLLGASSHAMVVEGPGCAGFLGTFAYISDHPVASFTALNLTAAP